MIKRTYILLLLGMVAFLSACIREDLSDCKSHLFHIDYKADGEESVIMEYVEDVDVYIFHESGTRLRSYTVTESHQGVELNLQDGEYTLVTVANAKEHTYINEATSDKRHEYFLQHPDWSKAGDVVPTHDHNYIGEVHVKITSDGIERRDTVMLRSSHVNMEIQIEGLPAPAARADIPYTLRIENSHARINFFNELSAMGQETVQPPLTYDAEKMIYHTTNLALYRMDQNGEVTRETCPHQVVLLDADGTELVRYDLYDYLQRYADQIDVTKQEATIPLAIQFHQLGVEIVLPGWNIEDVNPDWG